MIVMNNDGDDLTTPHGHWCRPWHCVTDAADVVHREGPNPPLVPAVDPDRWITFELIRGDEAVNGRTVIHPPELELTVGDSVTHLGVADVLELLRVLAEYGRLMLADHGNRHDTNPTPRDSS